MSDKPFEPKLGRIRDSKSSKPQRYTRRVLSESSRTVNETAAAPRPHR